MSNQRPLTVMQLLPELNSGGVERGTLEIARALVAQGHRSLVVSNGGRMVQRLQDEGSQHFTLPIHKKSLSSLWQIKPLRQLIIQQQPDIVHVRSRVPAWLTHFALKGIPVAQRPHLVSTVHGFYSVNAYSAIMTKAEKVIAVSNSVVDYIHQHYPKCPKQDIVRIYRGIDPTEFPFGYQPSAEWQQQVLQQFPQFQGKYLIALAGRITRLKGHETLIRVMQQLQSQYPHVHAVIIGDVSSKKQAYLQELKQHIEQLQLQSAITFVGHRSDMKDWLAFCDVSLSLSNQAETFGRTTLESLSLGRPVIGWNRGGVAEILSALYPQGLIAIDDEHALIQCIQQHIESTPQLSPVQQFSLQQMTDQTLALYQQLVQSPSN